MRNVANSKFLIMLTFLVGGCSGSGLGREVKDPSRFYGCYKYEERPMLMIEANSLYQFDSNRHNKIEGFQQIRNSYFVLTKNQVVIDAKSQIRITDLDTGFQYEFKQDTEPATLLISNKYGKSFELVKDGDLCSEPLNN